MNGIGTNWEWLTSAKSLGQLSRPFAVTFEACHQYQIAVVDCHFPENTDS